MSKFKHRRLFLCPAAKVEEVNMFLERRGYGPDNFSRALEKNGTVTQYVCDVQCDDAMLKDFREAMTKTGGKEKDVGGAEKADRLEKVLKEESLSVRKEE